MKAGVDQWMQHLNTKLLLEFQLKIFTSSNEEGEHLVEEGET